MTYKCNETEKILELTEFYYDYIKELSEYNSDLKDTTLSESEEYIRDLMENKYPGTHIYTIYTDENELCGFIIIGISPNCHSKCNFFIQELYISPLYRRKHYAKRFISEFAQSHKGKYCLFILKENKIALSFWDSVFSNMKATEIPLEPEPCNIDYDKIYSKGYSIH